MHEEMRNSHLGLEALTSSSPNLVSHNNNPYGAYGAQVDLTQVADVRWGLPEDFLGELFLVLGWMDVALEGLSWGRRGPPKRLRLTRRPRKYHCR